MATAVCPGSFDPFTLGHRYVVERAAARFDEVVVTVVVNPNKSGMFSVDERIALIEDDCADLPNVRVDRWTGLLVDFLTANGYSTIVKGLRSAVDFDYEVPMAQMNRELSDIETVFLLTDPGMPTCRVRWSRRWPGSGATCHRSCRRIFTSG